MYIIVSKSHNPYYNLSLEEVLLKDTSIKENILLLYVNHNTIVVGRNQNTHEEINNEFVKNNKIRIIRRVSGGGAVYHDKGNINFSFITSSTGTYKEFLEPIVKFLNQYVKAEFVGKNDITANGYKISGNAQYRYKNRMFHHGTLLFDSDLSKLGKALNPSKLKLQSKSIKSAKARVTNIKDLINKPMSATEFKQELINNFITKENAKLMDISKYKQEEIKELMRIRKSKEWNYGKNPSFDFTNEKRFKGGTIKLQMTITNNIIKDIRFSGDFLSSNDFENIYKLFLNKEYSKTFVKKVITKLPYYKDYFQKITKTEILSLFTL